LRQIEVGYRSNVKNKVLKESLMLTEDQSIVDMQFAVQYRISDAKAWLFNNNAGPVPDELIRQAAETAMREVVGQRGIDQVLYEEKEAVAKDSQKLMQGIADRYQAGVTMVDVTIQQAQPPEQVQAAFEDANKAAQDRERLINEGRAYANDVIPKARGGAARLLQEAEAHKQKVIATAQGDASRFKSVLTEYAKAPQVTRDRLYIETMQQIFSNTQKVYVDAKSPGSLLYLPLDKLIQASTDPQRAAAGNGAPVAAPERAPEPAADPRAPAPATACAAATATPAEPGDTPCNRILTVVIGLLVAGSSSAPASSSSTSASSRSSSPWARSASVVDKPGLHFKLPPPFQNIQYYDKRILTHRHRGHRQRSSRPRSSTCRSTRS
jgi:membrane protease subunit HflK